MNNWTGYIRALIIAYKNDRHLAGYKYVRMKPWQITGRDIFNYKYVIKMSF